MIKSLIFSVLILVVCNGEHPTPILDAIISGATKIRDGVHHAGSLISSLTHGPRGGLHIGGSFGINRPPGSNGYGPGQNGYGPGQNGYRPGPNGHETGSNCHEPGSNGHGPGQNGYGPRPNGQGYPSRPEYNQDPNNYNNQNNVPNYGQTNQNYNTNKNQPNTVDNSKQENLQNYNNDKKPSGDGKTTQGGTKDDDGPIRVPLNPNEVNYGGDKPGNSAPKRETNKNNEADDDQEYNIDIRFNNDE